MSDNLKHKILSGFIWQALDRVGTQGLQLVISVILARLLMPEDFGVLAVTSVFVVLCQVFVDSGFSTALIQKKDADELDCNSVFYINLVMAAIIYGILFFCARTRIACRSSCKVENAGSSTLTTVAFTKLIPWVGTALPC